MNSTDKKITETSDRRKENEKEKVKINIEGNDKNATKDEQKTNGKGIKETEEILGKNLGQEKGSGDPNYDDKDPKAYDHRILEYDPNTRNSFVRLVLAIVLVVLMVTVIYTFIVLNVPTVRDFYREKGESIMFYCGLSLIGFHLLMALSEPPRIPPFNYIHLIIVVIFMCNFVGAVTIIKSTHILIFAFLATAATVIVCVLLAFSKFDFTKGHLYVVAIVVTILTITAGIGMAIYIFQVEYKILTIIYLFLGGLGNVILLVMTLQAILGGRTLEISEDEHVLAAFMIYMAVPDLFLKLMEILGLFDE